MTTTDLERAKQALPDPQTYPHDTCRIEFHSRFSDSRVYTRGLVVVFRKVLYLVDGQREFRWEFDGYE